jgi:hypothetical protein
MINYRGKFIRIYIITAIKQQESAVLAILPVVYKKRPLRLTGAAFFNVIVLIW